MTSATTHRARCLRRQDVVPRRRPSLVVCATTDSPRDASPELEPDQTRPWRRTRALGLLLVIGWFAGVLVAAGVVAWATQGW